MRTSVSSGVRLKLVWPGEGGGGEERGAPRHRTEGFQPCKCRGVRRRLPCFCVCLFQVVCAQPEGRGVRFNGRKSVVVRLVVLSEHIAGDVVASVTTA